MTAAIYDCMDRETGRVGARPRRRVPRKGKMEEGDFSPVVIYSLQDLIGGFA